MDKIVIDDKYLKEYYNLTQDELRKCRALYSSEQSFTFIARSKHRERERQKVRGLGAIQSHPLVYVLSARVQFRDKSTAIYGSMRANYWRRGDIKIEHELFVHMKNDAQFVGTGGDLALKGYFSGTTDHACMPLRSIEVELELFDGTGSDFAKEVSQLDVEAEDYEVVRCKSIPCVNGAGDLILQYIVIPFGVTCCITISVYYEEEDDYSFDVSGIIVAKYGKTYGKYSSEGCILFDMRESEPKPEQMYEEEERESRLLTLELSRDWVALPAYSSLVVAMNLTIAGTDQMINVEDSVELFPQQFGSNDSVVLDDYIITVEAAWFPPDYHWTHHPSENVDTQTEEESIEEFDTDGMDNNAGDEIEGENEYADALPEDELMEEKDADAPPNGEMDSLSDELGKESKSFDDDNGLSSNTSPLRSQLSPFHAVEIFSVFIGREKSMAAQVYGSIEVISNYKINRSIFQSDDKDALTLSKDMKFIPVSDKFQLFRI